MKLLLKAALRTKQHLALVILSLVSLLALTVANQLEMFAFGVITNNGIDFFTLFSEDDHKTQVSWDQIEREWSQIDTTHKGYIDRQDIASYLNQKQSDNFFSRILNKIRLHFDLEKSFEAILVALVIIALYKAVCLFYSRYITQIVSIRISRDLRQQYFAHIQTLPLSFYHKYNIGALSARVSGDASQIALSLNSCITNYFHTPFTIVSTLSLCFYISWKLSLVIFIGLPLIVLPVILLTRKVKAFTRKWQKHQERFTSVLIDFLSGIKTVKIFSMEEFSQKKYEEQNREIAKLEIKTAKYDLLTRPILHTVTMICLASVIFFGLYALRMSISELLVYCGMLHLFYEPVKKFAEENSNIQKGVVAAERLFEVLNLKPMIEDQPSATDLIEFQDTIEFDKVWFKYDDKWVIRDLSFTIRKGETVAIIGATGAGKSTIVELLPRLYDPQKGEIRIDGKPLREYTQRSLREVISFVSQKPFLFYDTIENNISYGKPMSMARIVKAAQGAYADEFIEQLPKKYQTHLDETGKNLSGGQQQRLAIARALAKESSILIMDEATSALDAISENRVKQSIADCHGKMTQILIAHRLTTIEHADRIIFLEDGMKIAEGSKEELMSVCPQFKLMWETHFMTNSATLQSEPAEILEH